MVIEIKSKLDPALWFNDMPIQDCELTNRDLQFCFALEKIIQAGWLDFQDGKLAKSKGEMTNKEIIGDLPRDLWKASMAIGRNFYNADDKYTNLIQKAIDSGRISSEENYRKTELIIALTETEFALITEQYGEVENDAENRTLYNADSEQVEKAITIRDREAEVKMRIQEKMERQTKYREISKAMKHLGWELKQIRSGVRKNNKRPWQWMLSK